MSAASDSSSPQAVAGLLLAAGASRRFGSAKQLALLDGVPLVVHAVRALSPACPAGLLVVTGAEQAAVTEALAGEAVRCIYNPAWREGLGASLRHGMAMLPAQAGAVLVALADQPGLTTGDYLGLVQAWQACPAQPAAAVYGNQPGVPAVFPRSRWPALAELSGDRGARALLRSDEDLSLVPMPAAAWDVDEPADLARSAP